MNCDKRAETPEALKTDDDEGRVRALERYEVLDTDEEEPFENVVKLVQQALKVPMCAVSLLDRQRQWFKARRGLGVRETPRDISFCTHAIQQADAFIVSDAAEHPIFKGNPLVTGEPHIRAYAGIPLKTPDGYNLGSLCAIDDVPRDFQPHEISMLESFAKIVMEELELRQIASSDGLTGALTRRAWRETADTEIKRANRYGRPLSLAIMDIDKFKSVNDTYGHAAGDTVIKHLARLFMDSKRESDFFGRLGGEEFVLLMAETSDVNAQHILERLREEFSAAPIENDAGNQINCSFSAGIAELSEGEDLDPLLARADQCLYEAKNGGRNRTVLDQTQQPRKKAVDHGLAKTLVTESQ
ncbi:MAG: diguanylate cyclase [Alphaproteobacteria bacterium]|nr:diguanylate cyclase [Alphaproteobacteria bacterium]